MLVDDRAKRQLGHMVESREQASELDFIESMEALKRFAYSGSLEAVSLTLLSVNLKLSLWWSTPGTNATSKNMRTCIRTLESP
jgi:hypothetical protein